MVSLNDARQSKNVFVYMHITLATVTACSQVSGLCEVNDLQLLYAESLKHCIDNVMLTLYKQFHVQNINVKICRFNLKRQLLTNEQTLN